MTECILAWAFLLLGLFNNNEMYFIASGIFAVASNISRLGNNHIQISCK